MTRNDGSRRYKESRERFSRYKATDKREINDPVSPSVRRNPAEPVEKDGVTEHNAICVSEYSQQEHVHQRI